MQANRNNKDAPEDQYEVADAKESQPRLVCQNGSRVFDVAPRHIGLTGWSVEGIPTTGIVPALAVGHRGRSGSVHRALARRQPEPTATAPLRSTNHKIAQDSHSQMTGCCVHAN